MTVLKQIVSRSAEDGIRYNANIFSRREGKEKAEMSFT